MDWYLALHKTKRGIWTQNFDLKSIYQKIKIIEEFAAFISLYTEVLK